MYVLLVIILSLCFNLNSPWAESVEGLRVLKVLRLLLNKLICAGHASMTEMNWRRNKRRQRTKKEKETKDKMRNSSQVSVFNFLQATEQSNIEELLFEFRRM